MGGKTRVAAFGVGQSGTDKESSSSTAARSSDEGTSTQSESDSRRSGNNKARAASATHTHPHSSNRTTRRSSGAGSSSSSSSRNHNSGRASSSSSSSSSAGDLNEREERFDEILTYGAVTYVKDPNDNRTRRELKEVITEKLANEPLLDSEGEGEAAAEEGTGGPSTLLGTAAEYFQSAVAATGLQTGSATSNAGNERRHKPLTINDGFRPSGARQTSSLSSENGHDSDQNAPRSSNSSSAERPSGQTSSHLQKSVVNAETLAQSGFRVSTTQQAVCSHPLPESYSSPASSVRSAGGAHGASSQDPHQNATASQNPNHPKSLVIDESKLLGVQAPDGSSFLAYFKDYRQEFERISTRILKKRENVERRRLNPGTFFGMEHQTDGVLIDQMSDLEVLYSRHQVLFLCLLALDFLVMAQYLWLSWSTGMELWGLRGNKRGMHDIYWMLFGVQCCFCLFYYGYGVRACMGRAIEKHEWMGKFCVASIVGLVLMIFAEYVRKFNLFIFFMRLVMHLYSKFLITLNQHFFLSNSGSDVYQLLATQAGPGEEDTDVGEGIEDDYAETRQALMEIHRREAAEAV